MKKIFILTYLIAMPFLSTIVFAQTEIAKCKIATIARYTDRGIELRWMPDNKTILRLGFDNSYTIERSESNLDSYETIAIVQALTHEKWDSLITNEQNPEIQTSLEIGSDFLFAPRNSQSNPISLDAGIAELNEQKRKEDMVYTVFVFSTIKDSKTAQALGLGFIDKNVIEGRIYNYRIKLNGNSSIYKIQEGLSNIKAVIDLDKYKNEVFVYPGEQQLSFAWPSKPELAGYLVERAAEGETIFKPLNSIPFYASSGSGFQGELNGTFVDDSLTNYKWYQYRFYGNTSFGEKVLFAEVKGMPRDLTPPDKPMISQPKHIKPKVVEVKWEQHGNTKDLRGFFVAHSQVDTGDFKILHKQLLPVNSRSYQDTTFVSGGINYYIVYAIDTAGNLSASYPAYVALIDSIPPAKPEIISAIIDSLGIVTVTLKQGTEKDLKGYKLYMANSTEHEFSVIEEAYKEDSHDTSAIKLVFIDTVTLQSLTPKIYYRVKALDFNYNHSIFSEIVAVVRPDTIPPVTPVFNDVIVSDKFIQLSFVPSGSIDVKEHVCYRKTNLTDDWSILLKLDTLQTSVLDTNVTTGTIYYYSLRAMDENNLYSDYAHPVYGKPYDTGVRPPVENFAGIIEDGNVMLTWDYPPLEGKEILFVIYKKDAKGNLVTYSSTPEKIMTDTNIAEENHYAIKALTTDGGQSNLSEVLSLIKSE